MYYCPYCEYNISEFANWDNFIDQHKHPIRCPSCNVELVLDFEEFLGEAEEYIEFYFSQTRMMTFNNFLANINTTYNENELELRYGQVIMNVLYQVWPEKYNEISHTEYDCFYEDGWSFATSQTLEKLKNEWKND